MGGSVLGTAALVASVPVAIVVIVAVPCWLILTHLVFRLFNVYTVVPDAFRQWKREREKSSDSTVPDYYQQAALRRLYLRMTVVFACFLLGSLVLIIGGTSAITWEHTLGITAGPVLLIMSVVTAVTLTKGFRSPR